MISIQSRYSRSGKGEAYCFLMLSQSSVDDTTIEEDFGRVWDIIEDVESLLIFLVIVMRESLYPGLDFLDMHTRD